MLENIEFREPLWLLAAPVAVLVFFFLRKSGGRIIFGALEIWKPTGKSFKAKTSFVPALLMALAFVFSAIAMAGPRIPGGFVREHKQGISIALALDKSGSMSALDMSDDESEKTRMDVLKSVLEKFIAGDGKALKGRPNDAIAIVSFAGFADTDAPLTLDHAGILDIARNIEIVTDQEEDGTNIAEGLALAVGRLEKAQSATKIIVLMSDGAQNRGTMSPADAAKLAVEKHIKVYTIAIGKDGIASFRVTDPRTGRSVLQRAYSAVDEKTLREIAEQSGGKFFRAVDENALVDVYKTIDALEKSKIEEKRYTTYDEKFDIFAFMAAILIALSLILANSYYRRNP